MGLTTEIKDDAHFQLELSSSDSKLVVVDFSATWCSPCKLISPFFEKMSQKYPEAVFLKVDVDQCQDTAANQLISVLPTFHFFRNKVKLDSVQGADSERLEAKIKLYYVQASSQNENIADTDQKDLVNFIEKCKCERVSETTEQMLTNCLIKGEGYIESDNNDKMMLSIWFNQPVNITTLTIKGPGDRGPKTVQLFTNQINTFCFELAVNTQSTQSLEIDPTMLEGNKINLISSKFQNVNNIHLFIQDNQSNSEKTRLDHVQIIGTLAQSNPEIITGK